MDALFCMAGFTKRSEQHRFAVILLVGTDGGHMGTNVPVSSSFNPHEGWPVQQKIGDYLTIVSDNTGGDVAYSATFNFNPNTGQPNKMSNLRARFPIGRIYTSPTATPCDTESSYASANPTPRTVDPERSSGSAASQRRRVRYPFHELIMVTGNHFTNVVAASLCRAFWLAMTKN
jgi:hypothetical protein